MRRRALLAALLASGCGLSTREYVERREWPLVATRPDPLPPARLGPALLVRTTGAGPLTQARGLQTLQADGSVAVAFYDEWAAPPAEAVEAALRGWLADSGLFSAVLAPGSRLESDLTSLVAEPGAGQAKIGLSLVLLDQRSGTRVLLQREILAQAPLASGDATAEVAAWRAALADAMAQTERALAPFAARQPTGARASSGRRTSGGTR
jgi:ABC-type uncharacterized transport system auxiliary subunit